MPAILRHRVARAVKSGELNMGKKAGRATWRDYIPLIVVVAVTLLTAGAKQVAYGGWSWMTWMQDFMGFLMVVFSMFKLFDLNGYADLFQQYDLLAKSVRTYAYLYPFIQFGLGLGYLSHWQPMVINMATAVVLGFGAMGVIRVRFKGIDCKDACMGSMSRVPLSAYTLLEDFGMALMAAVMLLV
ncbi:MAG: MauE/DoxX family redox-associated membrane protein [Opitutaceae bacterium]